MARIVETAKGLFVKQREQGDNLFGGGGSDIGSQGLQDELDTVQGSLGDMIDSGGAWVGFDEYTNYLSATLNTTEALETLDAEIFTLSSGSSTLKKMVVVGEVIEADQTFLVRWSIDGETAGRVMKADNDTTIDDEFYVIGVLKSSTALVNGESAEMVMMGTHQLVLAENFAATDIGKPVYLAATGGFTLTPPVAANTAVYRIGIVEAVDKIFVSNMQLNSIN